MKSSSFLSIQRIVCYSIFWSLVACKSEAKKMTAKHVSERASYQDQFEVIEKPETPKDTTVALLEFFVDSVHVGRKKHNKLELSCYMGPDSNYVRIRFFAKKSNSWILKSEFSYMKDGVTDMNPKIQDFNNDNFQDMTYISDVAARGANEIRRLFIYDTNRDALISIVNSNEYPNLQYNEVLRCIDAFLVYGGCSTVFLHLKKDRLEEFASVELMDGLTVRTYDAKHKEKIIFQDLKNEAGYVRYKNFNPLTVNTNY